MLFLWSKDTREWCCEHTGVGCVTLHADEFAGKFSDVVRRIPATIGNSAVVVFFAVSGSIALATAHWRLWRWSCRCHHQRLDASEAEDEAQVASVPLVGALEWRESGEAWSPAIGTHAGPADLIGGPRRALLDSIGTRELARGMLANGLGAWRQADDARERLL